MRGLVEVKKLKVRFKKKVVERQGETKEYRYERTFKLVSANAITKAKLKGYVARLNARFPERGYFLSPFEIGRRNLLVIGDKVIDLPVFFDLSKDRVKVYVRRKDLKERKGLTDYILYRSLGALGAKFSYKDKRIKSNPKFQG
jgi:hypothetical protein